jgi:hypothetical protein
MSILLAQHATPPGAIAGYDWLVFEPLAPEHVAPGVARHHDVNILDLRFNTLYDTLDAIRPDVVGVTAYTYVAKGLLPAARVAPAVCVEFGSRISLIRRYSVKETVSLMRKSVRIQRRVRNAWKDYGRAPAAPVMT